MSYIDLNCDMGEMPGNAGMALDASLMPFISSSNIACGYHAGDEQQMFHTALLAIENGVSIGAHPGFADRLGFGRTEPEIRPRQVYQLTMYQIGAMEGVMRGLSGRLNHVKPHGALYNMAARDRTIADAIATAVLDFDPDLYLCGLPESQLQEAAECRGLRFVREGFADRRYLENGMLVPRDQDHALITGTEEMIAQSIRLINQGSIDSLCIHGDGKQALLFLKSLHQAFEANDIVIQPIRKMKPLPKK